MVVPQPQPNPKPHPVDYVALGLLVIGAAAQFAYALPPKYSQLLTTVAFAAGIYTKWLGSQQERSAFTEGQQAGEELKTDLAVMQAKPAEIVK